MKLDYELGEELTQFVVDELSYYKGFDEFWDYCMPDDKADIVEEIGAKLANRINVILEEFEEEQKLKVLKLID